MSTASTLGSLVDVSHRPERATSGGTDEAMRRIDEIRDFWNTAGHNLNS
jgi:hypothetical protein